ncbi:MAG TPA: valine--tRNA ligase [Phycisphaerae bacterium]|jgi:valyl-tRNA synthetase
MSDRVELDKVYNPKTVEGEICALWQQHDAFRAAPDERPPERRYCIVIPPPNVTGALHLGHAFNNTLQDILVRWHRMRGFNTLWQPGTDHAGIATQAVVEKRIRETEGKTRHQIGREELVRRIWEWKDQYEARILSQLKLMGCSCDWSRTRFTLDEGCSRAVQETFFRWFKAGLIYRGKRLVNWDTALQTAVADDELYYDTIKGHFWHIRYPVMAANVASPLVGGARAAAPGTRPDATSGAGNAIPEEPTHVVIATTRPETMLGDVAVAVHPDPEGELSRRASALRAELASAASAKDRAAIDAKLEAIAERRTSHLPLLIKLRDMAAAGRTVMLPLVNRPIPLILDEWADPMLGSGCVKITPAHDPNDFAVGERHKLPKINVLAPEGTVAPIVEPDGTRNPNSARYEGLPFSTEARARVVADIEAAGLLEKIEDREIEIAHSDRSKTPIEPYLSDQWFVRMGDLGRGIEGAQRAGVPRREVTKFTPIFDEWERERTKGGAERTSGITLGDGSNVAGLAQAAIDAVTSGRVKILPERYTKSYLDWLGEKRDWCISRQLWWGHRIPVWRKRLRISNDEDAFEIVTHGLDHVILGETEGASAVVVDCTTGQPVDPRLRRIADYLAADGQRVMEIDLGGFNSGELRGDFEFFVCLRDAERGKHWYELGFMQDPDVLDTWFSSQLWPFSTLGWPDPMDSKRRGLDYYYPTSALVTSREIITLWVARMVISGLYNLGKEPFHHVYIHTKILDARGETMSKSKGNGVDPVDIIDVYGADALRYTMADMATETQDARMPVDYLCPHCGALTPQTSVVPKGKQPIDVKKATCRACKKPFATVWADDALKADLGVARDTSEKFEIGRNFCNKLWNAARFALTNLAGTPYERLDVRSLPTEDRWILARLSQTIAAFQGCLAQYRFSAALKVARDFFWDSLCDWYIELTKPRIQGSGPVGAVSDRDLSVARPSRSETAPTSGEAKQVLAFCLDQTLRMLHPIMPFITERLWRELNALVPVRGLPGVAQPTPSELLITAEFPPLEGWSKLNDPVSLAIFEDLQTATRGIRDLRSKSNVPPRERVTVTIKSAPERVAALRAQAHIVQHLAGVGTLAIDPAVTRPKNAASLHVGALHIYVHEISDDARELQRVRTELAETEKQIASKRSKLSNENFVARADPEVVQAERDRLAELETRLITLRESLAELA